MSIFVTISGYLEPKLVKSAFDGDYIEYESVRDKNKNLLISGYLSEIHLYETNFTDYIKKTNNARKILVLV